MANKSFLSDWLKKKKWDLLFGSRSLPDNSVFAL